MKSVSTRVSSQKIHHIDGFLGFPLKLRTNPPKRKPIFSEGVGVHSRTFARNFLAFLLMGLFLGIQQCYYFTLVYPFHAITARLRRYYF